MKRHYLFLTLRSDEKKYHAKNCGNVMNSYGEMKLGNGKQGFNGKLESLPAINQAVHARHRIITKEVKEDEEEAE